MWRFLAARHVDDARYPFDGRLQPQNALLHQVDGAVRFSLGDLRLGPKIAPAEVEDALRSSGLRFAKSECPAKEAARLLADEQIVFWFQGPMEFGPRALGGRSILARPDRQSLRDRLNLKLKRRGWGQAVLPPPPLEGGGGGRPGGAKPHRHQSEGAE